MSYNYNTSRIYLNNDTIYIPIYLFSIYFKKYFYYSIKIIKIKDCSYLKFEFSKFSYFMLRISKYSYGLLKLKPLL